LHTTNYDPGGFAEYIRVPKINAERGVYLLPKNVSFEEGTFIEPLGCVVRGQRLARVGAGDTVLVIGSGISGLLHVQLARLKGVERVIATDISEYRLKAAKKFGADAVINAREEIPKKLREINDGRLADRVMVCTGAPSASEQALQCVDRGGAILFFAVPGLGADVQIPFTELWRNEISMMTSYGAAPNDLKEALKLLNERRINIRDMITHRLCLTEVGLGFKLVAEAKDSLKVIIEPQR
jgi:L-iditol 2-dehydrogenase